MMIRDVYSRCNVFFARLDKKLIQVFREDKVLKNESSDVANDNNLGFLELVKANETLHAQPNVIV